MKRELDAVEYLKLALFVRVALKQVLGKAEYERVQVKSGVLVLSDEDSSDSQNERPLEKGDGDPEKIEESEGVAETVMEEP